MPRLGRTPRNRTEPAHLFEDHYTGKSCSSKTLFSQHSGIQWSSLMTWSQNVPGMAHGGAELAGETSSFLISSCWALPMSYTTACGSWLFRVPQYFHSKPLTLSPVLNVSKDVCSCFLERLQVGTHVRNLAGDCTKVVSFFTCHHLNIKR